MSDHSFESFLTALQVLKKSGQAYVVVTLTHIEGSAPQELGARMIVTRDGLHFGTIGGGKVEAKAICKAEELLAEGGVAKQSLRWNLQLDVGMTCGGVVNLLFEQFSQSVDWNIVVFGAGHVAQALVPMLLMLEAKIFCWDSRQEWLSRFPHDEKLKLLPDSNSIEAAVAQIPENSFVVVMTMGHATDLPILKALLERGSFPYIGCMGSDVKALKIKKELATAGIRQESIQRLHCPIGEKMGNNSPVEISFSVVTELIKTRDGSSRLMVEC